MLKRREVEKSCIPLQSRRLDISKEVCSKNHSTPVQRALRRTRERGTIETANLRGKVTSTHGAERIEAQMVSAQSLFERRAGGRRRAVRKQKIAYPFLLLLVIFALRFFLRLRTTSQTESLTREAAVATQLLSACRIQLELSTSCARVLHGKREHRAGLGHQVSELVFFTRLSQLYGATLRLEPFGPYRSDHKSSHAFINSFLGLDVILRKLQASEGHLSTRALNATHSMECGVMFQGNFLECPGGNCFKSPIMHNAFNVVSPCFQALSKRYGNWENRNPYERYTFNVLWHVRVGDSMPHGPDDDFFRNVFDGLQPLLLSIPNVHHYICGEWNNVEHEIRLSFHSHFHEFLGSDNTHFLTLSLVDSLTYMMHSNMLIGSGSSLSAIVPLFSDKPLYVNVKPKHGWNFLAEHFGEAVQVSEEGRVLTPMWEIEHLIGARV